MSTSPRESDATMRVTPALPPKSNALAAIGHVLELTSMNANADAPARLTNLGQANITATFNRGAQNAIANQQAHAQLNLSIVGKATNRVQNLGPLEARSSVDVLTNDEVAQAIIDLRGALTAFGGGGGHRPIPPDRWRRLIEILKRMLEKLLEIQKINNRLQGDGTVQNPYVVTDQPLYVEADATIGFPGWEPDQLGIAVLRQMLLGK